MWVFPEDTTTCLLSSLWQIASSFSGIQIRELTQGNSTITRVLIQKGSSHVISVLTLRVLLKEQFFMLGFHNIDFKKIRSFFLLLRCCCLYRESQLRCKVHATPRCLEQHSLLEWKAYFEGMDCVHMPHLVSVGILPFRIGFPIAFFPTWDSRNRCVPLSKILQELLWVGQWGCIFCMGKFLAGKRLWYSSSMVALRIEVDGRSLSSSSLLQEALLDLPSQSNASSLPATNSRERGVCSG